MIKAYLAVRNSRSEDYVVVDPVCNENFLSCCRQLKASGSDFELNKLLLNLRKSRKVPAKLRSTKFVIPPKTKAREEFEFASEMAVRYIQNINCNVSLDTILCDPDLRVRFDEAAENGSS